MPDRRANQTVRNLLIIMPPLLGECVMATPALQALRDLYPDARITALVKHALRPVLYGLPSVDRVLSVRKRPKRSVKRDDTRRQAGRGRRRRRSHTLVGLGRRLSRGGFDTAVILPNAFKYAALAAVAGIPRRVGYEQDGRGVLLTDRLVPRKHRGRMVPTPKLELYLGVARYLGAAQTSTVMSQATHPEADARIVRLLERAGVDIDRDELLLINPGAPSTARQWSPRRFAHLCELMASRYGVRPIVAGLPGDRPVIDQVLQRSGVPIIDLPELGTDLHLLKSAIKRSRMVVTNDSGPRHLAAALHVPLLTLFGPTSPTWTAIPCEVEEHAIADGLSVSARDDPDFVGPGSLDRLHADKVFACACTLYDRTRQPLIGSVR